MTSSGGERAGLGLTHSIDPTELLPHRQDNDCDELPPHAAVGEELPGLLGRLATEGQALPPDVFQLLLVVQRAVEALQSWERSGQESGPWV